jgi:hypothetical protein
MHFNVFKTRVATVATVIDAEIERVTCVDFQLRQSAQFGKR